jgi:NhaA family Na+:H+ antiporter
MLIAAIAAIIVANTPAYGAVRAVLETSLEVGAGGLIVSITCEQFVNDFLMAIFFLLVGVELKYEMTIGQLHHPRQIALPMFAAVGGVMVPALIYLVLNFGGAIHGWATPIATDIAFALGVMSLLGDRIAVETKVFFQTLAIADDIIAIVVLALFYGQSIDPAWLCGALITMFVLALLNYAHVYSLKPYVVLGFILWVCMFNSGIHATLAGVILAFFLPSCSDVRLDELHDWLDDQASQLDDDYDEKSHVLGQHDFTEAAWRIERVMHHVRPPLQRMEGYYAVPVNFVILPLFAFVNAQVRVVGMDLSAVIGDPIVAGIFFGALLGKPIGVIGMITVLVKTGFSTLPAHMDWQQTVAVGLLSGVGFTMSILIAGLAFPDSVEANIAKFAVLAAAVTASLLGLAFAHISDALITNH